MKNLTITSGRALLTLSMVSCAAVLSWHLWSYYMEAPWTRDAHIRADIIRLAPVPLYNTYHEAWQVAGLVADTMAAVRGAG